MNYFNNKKKIMMQRELPNKDLFGGIHMGMTKVQKESAAKAFEKKTDNIINVPGDESKSQFNFYFVPSKDEFHDGMLCAFTVCFSHYDKEDSSKDDDALRLSLLNKFGPSISRWWYFKNLMISHGSLP